MPAPPANTNHLQHGRRARHSQLLQLGALPKGGRYIVSEVNRLRRWIEASLIAERGEVTLADAATIQTCCRWERHAQLAQRWLRLNPGLPVDKQLELSRDIARASERRDAAMKSLGLEPGRDRHSDPFAVLRIAPQPARSSEPDQANGSDPEAAETPT